MKDISIGNQKPFTIVFSIGSLGGVALIITTLLTSKGFIIFIPFAVLIIANFVILRASKWSSFSKRFTTSFLIFMVATIILYLFIGFFDAGTILDISVWGHIWRLGLMATIGGMLSLVIAYLTNI